MHSNFINCKVTLQKKSFQFVQIFLWNGYVILQLIHTQQSWSLFCSSIPKFIHDIECTFIWNIYIIIYHKYDHMTVFYTISWILVVISSVISLNRCPEHSTSVVCCVCTATEKFLKRLVKHSTWWKKIPTVFLSFHRQ